MNGTLPFLEGGSPALYNIGGGTRFWFNRLMDATTTPPRYRGWRDIGNVKMAPSTPERDEKMHYSNRFGGRKRDRSVTQEVGDDFVVTFDEMSAEFMFNYWKSANMTEVAASSGNAVTDEVHQVIKLETTIIGGYSPASIVVKDITGGTTYTASTDGANNDYVVVTIIGGYKGIKRTAGSTIADGDFLRINYTWSEKKHRLIKPGTVDVIQGKAIFFGVSNEGPEFVRPFNLVQLESEGSFEIKPDDWSEFQIKVKVLDDSDTNPTAPWGAFKYYGLNANIASGA